MEMFIKYLLVFAFGGTICLLTQLVIIRTKKVTMARILVTLVVIGAFLEGVGLFKILENVGESGMRVPIIGFGAALARGAINGAHQSGLLGVLAGPLKATAVGITVAILSAYLFALIFKAHTKKS